MNLKEIREMIDLMNEHDLTEFEVEREGLKVKLRKSSGEFAEPVVRKPREYYSGGSVPTNEDNPPTVVKNDNNQTICSPMVGTFYRSPSPEAPAFVENGQIVEVGQVVCIVEAMKLMNEIKSEIKGKVVELAVDNAQPVEFGQTLFVIEAV